MEEGAQEWCARSEGMDSIDLSTLRVKYPLYLDVVCFCGERSRKVG